MKIQELVQDLNSIYPCCLGSWKKAGQAIPPLPHIIVTIDKSDNFGADNKVYSKANRYIIDLYTEYKLTESEEKIESYLNSNNIFYETEEVCIYSENLYKVSFYVEF